MWPFKKKPAEQLHSTAYKPDAEASRLVIEMAKSFASGMQKHPRGWSRAFYRLEVSDVANSSSGSFVTPTGVQVMDVFAFDSLFEELEPLGLKLTARVKPAERSFCVLLLSLTSDFDYNIEFDWLNQDRWRISKMDGGTGIPEGK